MASSIRRSTGRCCSSRSGKSTRGSLSRNGTRCSASSSRSPAKRPPRMSSWINLAPMPRHRPVLPTLPMMRLGTLSGPTRAAMDGREVHSAKGRRPCIAAAPALTVQAPCHRRLGVLATGQPGALPCGALPVAGRAPQPCTVCVRAGPRPRDDVPWAWTMAARTRWMRT